MKSYNERLQHVNKHKARTVRGTAEEHALVLLREAARYVEKDKNLLLTRDLIAALIRDAEIWTADDTLSMREMRMLRHQVGETLRTIRSNIQTASTNPTCVLAATVYRDSVDACRQAETLLVRETLSSTPSPRLE